MLRTILLKIFPLKKWSWGRFFPAGVIFLGLLFVPFSVKAEGRFKALFGKDKPSAADDTGIKTWLCYYGAVFGYDVYSKFDLVVLDAHRHPALKHNHKGRPVLLAYLSVGEVNTKSALWPDAKEKSFLVKRNDFWDSWLVDIRDPAWQSLLFDKAIPPIFEKKFDGLFLDTFDSSLSLQRGEGKEAYQGTAEALVHIVKKMKESNPLKLIAVNRGLPVLPAIAAHIDFVIIEDLYSYYAGADKGYITVDLNTRKILLEETQKGLEINPQLIVLTLDYAAADQYHLAEKAISLSRKKGFIPYVSTYKLDQVFYFTLDR